MAKFAVYSPTLGKREDFPVILLNKALTPEISDMQTWNGELRKAKLRLPEFVRIPYEISSVSTSDSTITLTASGVTAEFVSSDSIIVYDTDGNTESHTVVSSTDLSSTVITVAGTISGSTPTGFVANTVNVPTTDPLDQDFLKVQTPDANEIVRFERFVTASQTERLVGFTKRRIYFWDAVLTRWNLVYTGTGDTTYWDADEYGDFLVATNGVDKPISWDGNTANTFDDLDTQLSSSTSDFIATAKYVAAYRNYIFLGNVVLSDATELQDSVYTSNIGEGVSAGGFRQDTDKDAGAYNVDGEGDISGGFGEWQGYLCIFKRLSSRKFWFVAGDIPFEQDVLVPNVGSSAPGSVINDKAGRLFFYGSDRSMHEVSLGVIDRGLNVTTRNFNPELNNLIRSTYVEEYNEVWWAVPVNSDSTANDTVIVFKEPGTWEIRNIPVVTFGQYKRTVDYTWNTLPFATWNDWAWDSWTSVDASAEFPTDLVSDSNGFVYQAHGDYADDGTPYTSSFVLTTDMANKQALPIFKRISQAFLYVRNEQSGTVTLETKRDTEAVWLSETGISGGSANLFGPDDDNKSGDILRQRIPLDLRSRHTLLRISGTTKFSFVGIEFEYEPVGDR